ncbi:hypothetical protein VJ282_33325 [Bacillus mycoides]
MVTDNPNMQYQGLGIDGRWVYGMAHTEQVRDVDGYTAVLYYVGGSKVYKNSIGIHIGEKDVDKRLLYVGDIVDILHGERSSGVRAVIEWSDTTKQMELVVYNNFTVWGTAIKRIPLSRFESSELQKTSNVHTEVQIRYKSG